MVIKKQTAPRMTRRRAPRSTAAPAGRRAQKQAPGHPAGKALFERLFEATPDGSLVIDTRGLIVLANRHAEEMLGYAPGELTGAPVDRLVAEDLSAAFAIARGAASRTDRPADAPQPHDQQPAERYLNLTALRKDGSSLPVEITFSPVQTRRGAFVLGLLHDISAHRRLENELQEMKQRLLDSVDTERARVANQLHDGPLQDLYGAYYQIQEIKPLLDESNQELADRALETIQSVNATLRAMSGELHPNILAHLGLQRAIRAHADRLQERLPNTAIITELDSYNLEAEPMLAQAQRLVLFRVYQKLVDNAARHAEAAHIWVRLKIQPGAVVLEVQDDGKGFEVPERWIELLRAGRYGLVRALDRVRSLNGRMEITSSPGSGTLASSGTLVRVTVPAGREQ